jgi:hypothetical protein
MPHRGLPLTALRLAAVVACLWCVPAAPAGGSLRDDEKGTFLGALFAPVPEALYAQLAELPRGAGVLVTHVLPDSPAARADLRRHDILLRYDGTRIRDCEHFVGLIRDDRPGRKVRLTLLRAGRRMTAAATLEEGPVLRIAGAGRGGAVAPEPVKARRAVPPVSVAATPMGGDQMKVTIAYYQSDTGQLRTLTCQGAAADIDGEVGKLPPRERGLVRAALERIRLLSAKK